MVYHWRHPGLEIALRSDMVWDSDIQIINVLYPGQPTTTIINIYNDPLHQSKSAASILQTLELLTNRPVIITGDWNLYYAMWANDTCNYRTNSQTETLIDWLTNHDLQLVNIPGVATFAAHSGRGLPSVIDLTFTNGQAAQHLMLYN